MNKKTLSMILSLVLTLAVVNTLDAGEIASPDDFFGFQLGADRKIARWDAIVEYFEVLAGESDKVLVTDMGPTTNGHPFLLVVVSSADNLARLERLREVNNTLFDAQGLDAITIFIHPDQLRGDAREWKEYEAQTHGTFKLLFNTLLR